MGGGGGGKGGGDLTNCKTLYITTYIQVNDWTEVLLGTVTISQGQCGLVRKIHNSIKQDKIRFVSCPC